MAVQEQIIRQPEFIEKRTEQLLESVFGPNGVANVQLKQFLLPVSVAGFQPLQNTALFSAAQ